MSHVTLQYIRPKRSQTPYFVENHHVKLQEKRRALIGLSCELGKDSLGIRVLAVMYTDVFSASLTLTKRATEVPQ